MLESKGTFFNFKVSKNDLPSLLSSKLSRKLHDIEKGNHDDEACRKYFKKYQERIGQKLPECQFKGNKSKIQKLIRKVHIDENGIVTEVQFTSFSGGAPTQQQGPSFMPQTPQQ